MLQQHLFYFILTNQHDLFLIVDTEKIKLPFLSFKKKFQPTNPKMMIIQEVKNAHLYHYSSLLYYSETNQKITTFLSTRSDGFTFRAEPEIAYGPAFGIYTGRGLQDEMYDSALKYCRTGEDSGNVDDIMNPDTNTAISYDCT